MLTHSLLTLTISIYSSPSELSTNIKVNSHKNSHQTHKNCHKQIEKKPKPQMKIPFFKTPKLKSIHRAGVLVASVATYNFRSWVWGCDKEEEMEMWTNERETLGI